MANRYGPRIVTDGLVLCLDAADKNSYPGTGTTWYDLSGGNYNATAYGSIPFSSESGGCYDFSGVTGASAPAATLGFTFTSNMVPTTGNFTISTWVKNPPATAGQSGLFSNAGGYMGYRFGVGKNGVYYLIGTGTSLTYKEATVSFLSTLNSTSWYNVVAVYARSDVTPQTRIYLNGLYRNSSNFTVPSVAFTNTTPGMIRSPCCLPLFNGKLAAFSVYNKSLSSSEILQNYNTTKTRFGL